MKKSDLTIGQTVFVEWKNHRGSTEPIYRVHISKIGNKYFYVNCPGKEYLFRDEKFHIDTMIHEGGGYSSRGRVYLTKKEIEDRNEQYKLYDEIKGCFGGYGVAAEQYSLDQLKRIKIILNEKI